MFPIEYLNWVYLIQTNSLDFSLSRSLGSANHFLSRSLFFSKDVLRIMFYIFYFPVIHLSQGPTVCICSMGDVESRILERIKLQIFKLQIFFFYDYFLDVRVSPVGGYQHLSVLPSPFNHLNPSTTDVPSRNLLLSDLSPHSHCFCRTLFLSERFSP